MIDCKQVAENLLRFRDGELSTEETEVLRQHLHLCPPCEHIFDGYEEVVEVLKRLKPVNMPTDFLARMKKCCSEELPPETS